MPRTQITTNSLKDGSVTSINLSSTISISSLNVEDQLTINATTFNYLSGSDILHRTALKIINVTPYDYSQLVINNQIDEQTIYIVTE